VSWIGRSGRTAREGLARIASPPGCPFVQLTRLVHPPPRGSLSTRRRAPSDAAPARPLHALPISRDRASSALLTRQGGADLEIRPHNLPEPLTSFIGRGQELAEVHQLLATTPLLTLAGTGGVGKTRLSYEIAASLLDARPGLAHAYRDGVWLVELAALADSALLPQAVATALGVAEEANRPLLAVLAEALDTRQLLLVLDNCEHLIEACALVADTLLRACPALRILATSRQPLGIDGETVFQVPPLSLSSDSNSPPAWPPNNSLADGSVASASTAHGRSEPPISSEAARLFAERARAALPAFTLTDRNVGAVEQICRRLDGLPLAIELAAARVTVLSPEQIEARLGDRFRFLSGGSRTALPRYRTPRALVDWSHDLLDEGEQILLRRLAVFAGGWTLEAAEAVCAGDGLAPDEVLDLLSGLVTKSLVQAGEQADKVRAPRAALCLAAHPRRAGRAGAGRATPRDLAGPPRSRARKSERCPALGCRAGRRRDDGAIGGSAVAILVGTRGCSRRSGMDQHDCAAGPPGPADPRTGPGAARGGDAGGIACRLRDLPIAAP